MIDQFKLTAMAIARTCPPFIEFIIFDTDYVFTLKEKRRK